MSSTVLEAVVLQEAQEMMKEEDQSPAEGSQSTGHCQRTDTDELLQFSPVYMRNSLYCTRPIAAELWDVSGSPVVLFTCWMNRYI